VDKKRHSKQHNLGKRFRSIASSENVVATACVGSMVAFLAILRIGVTNAYSGVPFWDEWNGSLAFISNFTPENLGSIFVQHNEHRIILFRLIALFNYHVLNGQIWFLVAINLTILVGIVHILFRYVSLVLESKWSATPQVKVSLISILVIIESSWMQEQNINWGFQSQFLLGIYLPLVAFFLLQKYWLSGKNRTFYLAILFGVLSAGTFASGIIVLPLMFLGALICKRNPKELLSLFLVSVLLVFLYFRGYSTPGQHSNPMASLFFNTFEVLKYTAVYLLSPVIKSIGEGNAAIILMILAGLTYATSLFFYRTLTRRNLIFGEGVLVLPILFLTSFVGLTALGRANFGAREALASRYVSVTLVFYVLITLVFISKRLGSRKLETVHLWVTLALVIALLMPSQLHALSRNNNAFDQRLSALGLNLGLRDDVQVSRIFPNSQYLYEFAPKIISANKGIFGTPLFEKSRSGKNLKISDFKIDVCEVRIDQVFPSSDKSFQKVFGWSFIPTANQPIGDFLVLSSEGKIVGAGMSGAIRTDVDSYLGMENIDAGFAFYLMENGTNQIIVNLSNELVCKLPQVKP
jgi:hypothetical protein